MGIDPWGDLEVLQALPEPTGAVYAVGDDVDMDDVGIVPMSLPTGNYSLTISNDESSYTISAYPFFDRLYNGYMEELSAGYTSFGGATDIDNNYECSLYMYRGAYFDVVSPVTVIGNKMVLSGKLSSYPRYIIRSGTTERNIILNSSDLQCCLLVNGEPVGEYIQGDTLDFTGYVLDLSDIGTVTSLGIRVRNASSESVVGSGTNGFVRVDSWSFGWYVSDTLLVEGGQQGGVDEETKGLLGTIIGWLTQIKDGITGVAGAIAALPGQFMSVLIDGLKSLFIPSQDDFTQLKAQYEALLSERLGFVWQVGEWVVDFGQSVLSAMQGGGDYAFNFPGITVSLPEGTFTVIPAQTVSFDNAAMNVVRPVVGTAVSLVSVLAFLRTAERMLVALISGVSYFHWLKGDDDNAD